MLANLEIWERSQREPRFKGMGTTCVAMYFLDDALIIGHVGDSRCYRARGTELTQLTEDHSLINDYIRMKRVTPEEAENWPHKNVIVRALGMKESVQVDIITEKPHVGDTYLLCSDGLTGMLKDDQIAAHPDDRARPRSRGRAADHGRERGGRRRQHLGRARARRGGVSVRGALAVALALGAGCAKQAEQRRARRGHRAAAAGRRDQARPGRVQGLRRRRSARAPTPAAQRGVRAREGAARCDRRSALEVAANPETDAARRACRRNDSVRKTIADCIEQTAKLPALGCP